MFMKQHGVFFELRDQFEMNLRGYLLVCVITNVIILGYLMFYKYLPITRSGRNIPRQVHFWKRNASEIDYVMSTNVTVLQPPIAEPQDNMNANASHRRKVLCFVYNGEKQSIIKRIAAHPNALLVVSESLYGHNGLSKEKLYWGQHFREQKVEYVQLTKKVYDKSSIDGRWAQETTTRQILGKGVKNMYERGEIGDDDIVVVSDADENVSGAALEWLQMNLRHGQCGKASFRWFLFTHCYEHSKIVRMRVAVTVKTLRENLNWDTHEVRRSNKAVTEVQIDVAELSTHCSWCLDNDGIREKMRLNIEGSSWQSRGASYVFTDTVLNQLRLSGTWFDGNIHGTRICTTEQIIAEMQGAVQVNKSQV